MTEIIKKNNFFEIRARTIRKKEKKDRKREGNRMKVNVWTR